MADEAPAEHPAEQPKDIGAPGIGTKPPADPEPEQKAPPEQKEESGKAPPPDADKAATPPEESSPEDKAEAEATKAEAEAWKFTVPEGVTLDEKATSDFVTLAKEAGITDPKVAQKFVDFHVSQVQAMAERATADNRKAWDDMQAQWSKELQSDPVLGGTNAKNAQVVIGAALDEFGSKEAREAFDLTGAGNNPHVARFIYNMAHALVEGSPLPAGGTVRGPRTMGDVFYGKRGD